MSMREVKSIAIKNCSNSWRLEISNIKTIKANNLQSPIPTPKMDNRPRVRITTKINNALGNPLTITRAAT